MLNCCSKFLNPTSTEKPEVQGIRALRVNKAATVQFKDGVSDPNALWSNIASLYVIQPSQDLSSAIDSFLGAGPGVDTGVKAGFKVSTV